MWPWQLFSSSSVGTNFCLLFSQLSFFHFHFFLPTLSIFTFFSSAELSVHITPILSKEELVLSWFCLVAWVSDKCMWDWSNISDVYFIIFALPPGAWHNPPMFAFQVSSLFCPLNPTTTKHQHHDGQSDEEALENGHKLCCYISWYQDLHFFTHLFSFPE